MFQYVGGLCLILSTGLAIPLAHAGTFYQQRDSVQTTPAIKQDTTRRGPYKASKRPTYRQTDRYGDPFSNITGSSPLFLKDPAKMKLDVDIDTSMNYTIYEKIGNLNYRPTSTMSFQEFKQQQERQQLKQYWQTKSRAADGESAVSQKGFKPKIFVSPVLDRIFGGSYVELTPRGFVTLDFGASFQRTNNPQVPVRQQRNGGFQFDQQINMSVVGKVGEKLAVTANFDNNNSFDFQNNMKVEYTGFKEDILQKLEIGNISLPLNNTLIQGAQNLFGIKAKLQFGKLNVTAVASTQRGKVSSIDIGGNGTSGAAGTQGRPIEIQGSNYDDNRHFFLSHFFRDHYEQWVSGSPQITSGVNITRVEVYVLNRNNDTQTPRNIVGMMDLGEPRRIYNPAVQQDYSYQAADNKANNLYNAVLQYSRKPGDIDAALTNGEFKMASTDDYEKITRARRLAATEFTYHKQLGYVTLTRKLQNDELLAVAYEYTYNGRAYQVGELSEIYASLADEDVIYLKLLRPRKVPKNDKGAFLPMWDLMMKNIYSLGVTGVGREGFQLRVIYRDDVSGIDNPQLQVSPPLGDQQLVTIMGLDKLNPVNDAPSDGNFDFVEGLTINSAAGLVIFPYLEPLNKPLRNAFKQYYPGNPELQNAYIKKYVYDTLYRDTKANAETYTTKNKFFLMVLYSAGSSKDIPIPGFGVSQGSVKVLAGGTPLIEGTDYTIDYTLGKVTILNEAILSSGKNISIQYEQADPFSFQTRSLLGTRLDYKLNDDVNFGGTLLYYNERPLVSRNAIGTEPARNIQYGLDANIRKNSRMLTKLVDALPILQTKETSSVNLNAEFAQLIPGTSNIIDGQGTGYIDDFENTATPISLLSPNSWKIAATPKTTDNRFGIAAENDISINYQRAKLAWYTIDNVFYRTGGQFKPENISSDEILENHYTRQVSPQEIFQNKNRTQGNFFESVFDMAYYPAERGPYNYSTKLTTDGHLQDPYYNWAGITTAIKTETDFDKANVEYIEFWLLDPFIKGQYGEINDGENTYHNINGGKLIFQLGNISEDVARDGQWAFENGLPETGIPSVGSVVDGTEQNDFGYVTTQQFVLNAFTNNSKEVRHHQDVGFDGVPDALEKDLFKGLGTLPGDVQTKILEDPSADNFKYYLGGDQDSKKVPILGRYKNYNGLDGNSPLITAADVYTPSGSATPDNEDINNDNTISRVGDEGYFQYSIDLKDQNLAIGKNYIVDEVYTNGNRDVPLKQSVHWYLFRIPIRNPDVTFNISDFHTIKYVRMLLTEWKEPVVLRMANFRLVASKWRQYSDKIHDGGLFETQEKSIQDFTLSVVSLEENAQADPNGLKSAYVKPPGVVRDRDNSSTVYRQLNEQSVQICVDELPDGESRAIFKNVSLDLFNYGRIKMYFHADSKIQDSTLFGFLRLGTDADENYYEIQVPLKISRITDPRHPDPYEVWPDVNNIDLDLNELYGLKAARDREGAVVTLPYPLNGYKKIGHHLIRIVGRPDLSAVRFMMIGAHNPVSNDQQDITACVWANELRVTDFNRVAGWAVNSSINIKLADFATINGSLRYTTFGFGGVSSKISERTRDETLKYDVSANVNVDKLIPGNTGIKIPMFVSYGKTTINPNYDPANPDMKLAAALSSFNTDEERRNFKHLIQDQTTQRSINFVNVKKTKVKTDAKSHIYDIENLAFSYSYRDAVQTNYFIKEALQRQYTGSAAYNFAPKATGVEPFKDVKFLKSPWLKLIKDFNFSLMPSNLSARGDIDRSFNKKTYRTAGSKPGELGVSNTSNYMKYFTFNRTYNVRWNFSKNLSLEVSARANSIIDEPDGDIDTQEKKDIIINNVKKFGRMKNYDQNFTVNYTVPLDKIPLTSFMGAEYRYQASYNWKAGPLKAVNDTLNFGNIISNTRDNNFTGKIDLLKLYNKVKFLKELNTPPKPVRPLKPGEKPKPVVDTTWHMPGLLKGALRLVTSLRSINASYTLTESTILPGFDPVAKRFGMDEKYEAPGWGFILGSQDPTIRQRAAQNGWLTKAEHLTTPFTQNQSKTLDIKGNMELSPDLKVQLNLRREESTSYQEIFRYNSADDGWASLSPARTGSYKISYVMIKTAFDKSNVKTDSKVFHDFEQNLTVMQTRFKRATKDTLSLEETSQDVTTAAFLAAYTGKDPSRTNLSAFPRIPLPNWRLDYTGLQKLNGFKDLFQSVTISHAYSSSYSVSNYTNSLQYRGIDTIGINVPIEDYNNGLYGRSINGKYVPIFVLGQVFLSEQFSPLIGINVKTKSRLTANFQYKTKRDLALNISNAQITEINGKDVSFEFGFTKNNMKLPFKVQGETVILKNDVTMRLNLTVSNNQTIQRKVHEINTITAGNTNIQIRPNISYVVNQKLNLQLYFERTINDPKVSNNYRRTTTKFGIQIRFSLSQ